MTALAFSVPGPVRGKGRRAVRSDKGKSRPSKQSVPDRELIAAYRITGNVHKAGRLVGMTGGSAHERLAKLGEVKPINKLSDTDLALIRHYYWTARDDSFDLAPLAIHLGRTKALVCRAARAMGLTSMNRPMTLKMLAFQQARLRSDRAYSRAKRGRRPDLGDTHFRSSWEANYARYLNWLQARGEIDSWEFEPDTFWFEKIKRGIRSYLPDFRVHEKGQTYYVEVKGWMDDASKTKIKRMRIYHPHVELRVVDAKQYRALASTVGRLIPNWEGSR